MKCDWIVAYDLPLTTIIVVADNLRKARKEIVNRASTGTD